MKTPSTHLPNTHIRPVTNQHERAAWWSLWSAYLAFYKTALPEAVVNTTWSRLLDPTESMWAALAWQDEQAVGLVHTIEHRSCWTQSNHLYLQDLFVASAARGMGLGRALITHAQNQAQALGCSRLHWLTHESNHTAMALYDRVAERSGFVQYRKVL